MKKFSFSLDSLLSLRDLEEQNARTALAEANAQVARIEREISELETSVDQAYASWNGESGRCFNAMDRLGLSGQVAELKRRSAEAAELKRQFLERRSEAMDRFNETMRNRKVVTNLKEKRLREYQAEVLKQEAIEIEDIFNARRSVR